MYQDAAKAVPIPGTQKTTSHSSRLHVNALQGIPQAPICSPCSALNPPASWRGHRRGGYRSPHRKGLIRPCNGDESTWSCSYTALYLQPRSLSGAHKMLEIFQVKKIFSLRKRKAAPYIQELAWCYQLGLGILLSNRNNCPERQHQTRLLCKKDGSRQNKTNPWSCQNTDKTWTLFKPKHTKHPPIPAKISDLSCSTSHNLRLH